MASDEQDTKTFMTAYSGLKTAAKALEEMSHETEPDLDNMLVQVKRAKQHYDKCNQIIENIKSQVDSIFSGSIGLSKKEPRQGEGQIVTPRMDGDPAPRVRISRDVDDDEIPF
jgi:hypothetical protein